MLSVEMSSRVLGFRYGIGNAPSVLTLYPFERPANSQSFFGAAIPAYKVLASVQETLLCRHGRLR